MVNAIKISSFWQMQITIMTIDRLKKHHTLLYTSW